MRSINFFAKSVLTLSILMINATVIAHEGHEMVMPSVPTQPAASSDLSDHAMHKMLTASRLSDSAALPHHDHRKEHGAQIYAVTTVENKWLVDPDGTGTLKAKLETRIGTDEHKIFIKLHADKDEAQDAEFDGKVLYSRMISDFWDAQLGMRYSNKKIAVASDHKAKDTEEKLDGVLGLHGLAPYFFETDADLYIGQDSFVGFSLETERDLLLSQKLIIKPYLELDLILNDASKYAQKSGLDRAKVGFETRYELNKKVMPFIDLAYQYRQGREHIADQDTQFLGKTASEKTWLYGAGLRFKF